MMTVSSPRRNRPADIRLRVVNSPEDLQQAFAVRILVYIGEQSCPWHEEFDGNDYTATQILGTVDGEPAITARIRWFAGFAKLERLAVRADWRGCGLGHDLLGFMIGICRKKGFNRLYLHAQERLVPFYESYGFRAMREGFGFSDHDYVEMLAELPTLDPAMGAVIDLSWDPMRLNRPEGAWEAAGILEQSLARLPRYHARPAA